MAAFDYRQALEIRDALARHEVRYLFIGKAGAVLLGFPDTTQDADLFVERSRQNGRALVAALGELGFPLTETQAEDIERGKDFVQLKNGPDPLTNDRTWDDSHHDRLKLREQKSLPTLDVFHT